LNTNTTTFESLGLSNQMNRALADMGFVTPSPIQQETIPLLMQKRDVIGQAQTGTGKTAAFAIPIIENLDMNNRAIQAVILCPTRELAIQVAVEFRKLIKYHPNCSVVSIYGGQPIDRQFQALRKRPQIVIGTPGRMLDHLRRKTIQLGNVKTIVLDEADEMLDMGFRDDIELILNHVPQERQTVLFSATMPRVILELARKYQNNPEKINVVPEKLQTPPIEQHYFEIAHRSKLPALTHLLNVYQLKLALVFCNTKRQVDDLVYRMQSEGHLADGLHGGMSQSKRDRVMGSFRKGTIHVLVATDVAARGIDVQDIQAVFNYDLPEDTDNYIHRIGRTGRAGKMGMAFTFVSSGQGRILDMLQKTMDSKLKRQIIPGVPEIQTAASIGDPGGRPSKRTFTPRRRSRSSSAKW